MLRMGVVAVTVGAGCVTSVDENIQKRINAAVRIGRLVATAGTMTCSYSAHMAKDRFLRKQTLGKGDKKEYDDAIDRLKKLQEDQEKDTIVQLTTNDTVLRNAMTEKIARTREEIDATSDTIANLSPQPPWHRFTREYCENPVGKSLLKSSMKVFWRSPRWI